MRKPAKKRRGFDTGGLYGGPGISSGSLGNSIMSGFGAAMGLGKAYTEADDKAIRARDQGNQDATKALGDAPMDVPGSARGGRIKRTAGPKIGKDDGLIPAQRGEYVIRKSAVKKLGTKALAQVNKGKLPASRGR